MNQKTAKTLHDLTNDFYAGHHRDFSATRQAPWPGWSICSSILKDVWDDKPLADTDGNHSVLDVACGNLRFEHFLSAQFPHHAFTFHAVDNCDPLLPSTPQVHYQHLDVIEALQKGQQPQGLLNAPACDLVVCFGFMHHVPLKQYQGILMRTLLEKSQPGGYVMVSFWRFLNDEGLAHKARSTTDEALTSLGPAFPREALDGNDFLLGWSNLPGVYRYCHSFLESEIDQLIAAVSPEAALVSRFASDGRTGDLNTYVVLRRQA